MMLIVYCGLFLLSLVLLAMVSWFRQRSKQWKVDGLHIVISGGSEGLGLEFAKLLASKGAHISVISRNQEKLNDAKVKIEEKRVRETQKVAVYSADVANSKDLDLVVNKAIDCLGPIDVMIANAGMSIPKYFSDLSEEELWKMMDVNFYGGVNLTRSCLPLMKKARAGKLVFVASAMSVTAFCGYSGYCASKWAIRGFAEALQSEVQPFGISMHMFYAPTMKTPGLINENKVKPSATWELESLGDALEASDAAQVLFDGIAKERFAISGDVGVELFSMGALLSPYHNEALRLLLSPIIAIMSMGWRFNIDRIAKKHIKL